MKDMEKSGNHEPRCDCFSCSGGNPQEKIQQDIDREGWSAVGTSTEMGSKEMYFTYSIGLNESYNIPELLVFGLNPKIAHQFIKMFVELSHEKTFKPGVEYNEFASGFMTKFKNVSGIHKAGYMTQAHKRYGDVLFPAMYLIFPDPESKWSDESKDPMQIELQKIWQL